LSKTPSEFEVIVTENVKSLVREKFANLKNTIKGKTNALKTHPYDASVSERLRHDLVGLRTVKIKKNFLMLISICKECREQNRQGFLNCKGCKNRSDNSVMIFTIGPHDDVYATAKKFLKRRQMPS